MSWRQILSEDFQSSWSYVGGNGGKEKGSAMVRMSLSPFHSGLAVAGTQPGEAACWELERLV